MQIIQIKAVHLHLRVQALSIMLHLSRSIVIEQGLQAKWQITETGLHGETLPTQIHHQEKFRPGQCINIVLAAKFQPITSIVGKTGPPGQLLL